MPKASVIVLLLYTQAVWAQSQPTPRQPDLGSSELERRLQQQIFEGWALESGGAKQILARRQAEAESLEFYRKARHFVELWRSFAADLDNQKTVNIKLAKQVSKAFHDLEKSNGWPAGRSK